MLDRYTVADFQHKEIRLEAYRAAIRKLRIKDYTRKEMMLYFNRLPGLGKEDVEILLNELEEKGYINDQRYVLDRLDSMQFSLTGKGKIRRTLLNKGIDPEIIDQALNNFDDEQEADKARKMAEKLMNSVKDKSAAMKKQTIIQKLIRQGFDGDLARSSAEELDFSGVDDSEALTKTIQKALRNYARRYQGVQLRNKVIAYCLQKGFRHEDVIAKIEEMEWQDE